MGKLGLVVMLAGLAWWLGLPALVAGILSGLLVLPALAVSSLPSLVLAGLFVFGLVASARFRRLTWSLLKFTAMLVGFLLLFGWLFGGPSSDDDDAAVAALLLE